MKLFVWNDVGGLTRSWHDGGGLVIIADDIIRARELIARDCASGGKQCEAIRTDPDITRECEGPELIEIHPNAGCC